MSSRLLVTVAAFAVAALGLSACGKSDNGGATQKATGEVKETVGSITGDSDLKREGQKDQVVGGMKETLNDAKETVKDAAK